MRAVSVVAVGDQELGVGELGGGRSVDLRVVDAPDAVRDAVVVEDLGPRLGQRERLDVPPRVAGYSEKIGENGWAVLGKPQAVLGPGWVRSCGRTRPGP